MKSTLKIADLSVSMELDGKALSAVRGGQGNQANGVAQTNVQNMLAAANVGNASMFMGPTTIQSDNTFDQYAYNSSYAINASAFAALGLPF